MMQEEPSADMRLLARNLRDMYVALTLEGFSEAQAMFLVASVVEASAPGSTPK